MISKIHNKESGNVLFLILIAVALFAALSYAVTQSTRSGGGSTEKEQSLLSSASLTQYPTALRTAIVRMVLSGTSTTNLWFNDPAAFGTLSTVRMVFHPSGGGASYQQAPVDVMSAGSPGTWSHNMQVEVPLVGSNGANGNDLITFLPGVSESACLRINQQMGIPITGGGCGTYHNGVPEVNLTNTDITVNMTDSTGTPPSGVDRPDITCGTVFNTKASGCFYDSDLNSGQYVFYSVLIER